MVHLAQFIHIVLSTHKGHINTIQVYSVTVISNEYVIKCFKQ